ncbi:MAG: LysM domain-containing protein, partial [Chloroflexi bacterium]|nr:LysM domain-containing protein [Chloroflexota bacterium]
RNNTGGLGVLQNAGATIELNGCVLFVNNTPRDISGSVTDNRASDCDAEIVNPVIPIAPPPPNTPPAAPIAECNPHCPELQLQYCDIQLGAIGRICRPRVQPPAAYVYRVNANSEGFFKLGVTQPQVEAVENGLVACSTDGRVAVRVGLASEIRHFFENDPKYHAQLLIPRRYIVISKGPNVEGKVNHVVLDNALDGRAFGIVSTYGGPPAAECVKRYAEPAPLSKPARAYAPPVQPQAPQPDGSIIHVVRPGDTISAIAVAYRAHQLEIIMLNQLEHMGRWIYPGQSLLIREAGGD